MDRRELLKLGACALLGTMIPEALFAAINESDASKDKKLKFSICKGNRCKRCVKMLEGMLNDDKYRAELDEIFGKKRSISFSYGSRAKTKSRSRNIQVGKCSRKTASRYPIAIIKGCPPKPEAVMAEIKKAKALYDDENTSSKVRKKYKRLFG